MNGTVDYKRDEWADEDPRKGRLSTSTDNSHFDEVSDLIHPYRRLTITEVAEKVDISCGSC